MQREELPLGKPRAQRLRGILCTALFAFLSGLTGAFASSPIPSLAVGNNVYSNVVIRETSQRSVTIAHSRGMATLSLDKMTREERASVGIMDPEPEPPATAKIAARAGTLARSLRGLNVLGSFSNVSLSNTQAMELVTRLETPEGARSILNRLPTPRAVDLVAPAATFVLLSMCFVVICARAGKPAPFLGWIPLVQVFALYRAAKMSPLWFVVMLLNLFLQLTMVGVALSRGLSQEALTAAGWAFLALLAFQVFGWVIWCFKISKACGKSPAVGFLLLLPGLNLLGLAYLTFSRGNGRPAPAAKITPTPEPAGLRLIL